MSTYQSRHYIQALLFSLCTWKGLELFLVCLNKLSYFVRYVVFDEEMKTKHELEGIRKGLVAVYFLSIMVEYWYRCL